MLPNAIRVSTLVPCAALLMAALLVESPALQASTLKSEKIEIPFSFEVRHKVLPAGEYQIEQPQGSDVASLVNTKTGARINFLRPPTTHREGKARLVFENKAGAHSLKSIS